MEQRQALGNELDAQARDYQTLWMPTSLAETKSLPKGRDKVGDDGIIFTGLCPMQAAHGQSNSQEPGESHIRKLLPSHV